MHQHVVPRWKGDTNFMPVVGDTLVLPEVLPDSWAKLRDAFAETGMTTVSPGIFKAYDVRGTYPDQIDEDVAYRVGRAFARVLRDLRAAGDRTLRVAVGHDMRLHSPALAESFARGMTEENCDVLDIGEVGTEMVYYAVGSREMDGGVSVTASHNPKQWAGFKLVREGALPLSGDVGIPDVQRVVAEDDFPPPDGTGTIERADLYEEFQRYALGFIDPDAIRPMKLVLDGGNGMAGPMIGPLLDSFPVEGERLYFEPNGEFPGHEPNPLLEENRKLIIDTVLDRKARARHRLGRRRRPLLLHRRPRRVRAGRLPHRAAGRGGPREGAGRHDPLRRARQPRGPGHGRAARRPRARQSRRPCVLQGAHAGGGRGLRRRGLGPLLLPRLLVRRLGRDPRAAGARAAVGARQKTMSELLQPFRDKYFISGEINSTVGRPGREDPGRSPERYSDGEVTLARRRLGRLRRRGTSTCGRRTPSPSCA